MPERIVINTDKAPKPIGPYSHANRVGNMVFTSGQIGSNPETRALVSSEVTAQTRQALANLKSILECSGSGLKHVVKCTVFLVDMNDFPDVNKVYQEYFTENFPARSCVQVARLPMDARVEIEAVAFTKDSAL